MSKYAFLWMPEYLYFYRFIFVPEFACNLWNILKNKYNLVDITLYDMFPNTNHVESVCLFKIK